MHSLVITPEKGSFLPGEPVRFSIEVYNRQALNGRIRLRVSEMERRHASIFRELNLAPGHHRLEMQAEVPPEAPNGYGAHITLLDEAGKTVAESATAFDVLSDWTEYPRYGFLTDFVPDREDAETVLESLMPFHINGLQFYDWQYRHDNLLPPAPVYTDPLGRQLALSTVIKLINSAHLYGIAAMSYLAIYGASIAFWKQRQDWGLFDRNGEPHRFFDFLAIMDPTSGSPWNRHLLEECAGVLSTLPFDGLHVDQYGDPKRGFNAAGRPVDLPKAFSDFIASLHQAHPGAPLVFNAVGNWPIKSLASSPASFDYIEIWPPDTAYEDLARIVLNARDLSGNRPVVIAMYMPAAHEANHLLANAVILAAGGSRILMGENGRLLTDPYFPKHEAPAPELLEALRLQSDLAVRYQALTGPQAGHIELSLFDLPDGILAMTRRGSGWLAIHLINFSGLPERKWDQEHPWPSEAQNLKLRMLQPEGFQSAWWIDPESADMQPCPFERNADEITFSIKTLEIWGVLALAVETEESEQV